MGKILKVTMHDIAKEVGLSQSTVSLALRNNKRIPEKTRQRIRDAADNLGYESGAEISTLMARIRANKPVEKHATIAAITHHQADSQVNEKPVFKLNWTGASQRCKERGYQLEEFPLDAPGMSPARLSKILLARNIEGIIVFPFIPAASLDLEWERFSAVAIGYNLLAPKLNRVTADQYGNIQMTLNQLKQRGYRKPGLVIYTSQNERSQRRWMSPFYGFAFDQNTDPRGSVLLLDGHDEKAFREWIDQYQPDSIIGCGLIPIKKWLDDLGLKIPQDIGLAGVSDAFGFTQKCSRAGENHKIVGAAAADLLVAQLHRNEYGIPQPRAETFIPGKWLDFGTLNPIANA